MIKAASLVFWSLLGAYVLGLPIIVAISELAHLGIKAQNWTVLYLFFVLMTLLLFLGLGIFLHLQRRRFALLAAAAGTLAGLASAVLAFLFSL